jgi:DNA phosphorothioation-associated putative methyltransferase
MTSITIARHRTALSRHEPSRPIRLAINNGLISSETHVLDYGCGRGADVQFLSSRGIHCTGWDPIFSPGAELTPADVVNLGYVVNVIEDSSERDEVIRKAWALTRKLLIISARLTLEAKDKNYALYEDGFLTRRDTFQKYYEQHELRGWIDNILGVSSVPAAPGIFYVFRDENLKQSFSASKYRRQTSAPRQRRSDAIFEKYRELFGPLMEFIASRGRLPNSTELSIVKDIEEEIGSLRHAFRIIQRVTGCEQWERIREDRSQDLLLYLALSRFGGRPRLSALPFDIQLDIKAFFSSYRYACELADALLFSAGNLNLINEACQKSPLGKLTPGALYIHVSALMHLPHILRVYEGCARAYIGAVEGANIIKLHRGFPQVSYLCYPEFDTDPHPTLLASLIVPLTTFHIHYREYTDSKNPPILHRKEAFLHLDHPLRDKFDRLTRQEEKHGLYKETHTIGTRDAWNALLDERRLRYSGHRLVKTA